MTAKFTACITGYPEPEYEWYRDDTKLWPTDRILMENEGAGLLRLSIYHTDEDDAGKYTLRIFNPYGEDKSTGEMIFDSKYKLILGFLHCCIFKLFVIYYKILL